MPNLTQSHGGVGASSALESRVSSIPLMRDRVSALTTRSRRAWCDIGRGHGSPPVIITTSSFGLAFFIHGSGRAFAIPATTAATNATATLIGWTLPRRIIDAESGRGHGCRRTNTRVT